MVLVCGCSWSAKVIIVSGFPLPTLDQGHEMLLVLHRERGCINDCAQRLDQGIKVARRGLLQECWVLRRLALDDSDCPAESIDGINELSLACSKISCLFASHGGRFLKL